MSFGNTNPYLLGMRLSMTPTIPLIIPSTIALSGLVTEATTLLVKLAATNAWFAGCIHRGHKSNFSQYFEYHNHPQNFL
jgi:hypothetical protein